MGGLHTSFSNTRLFWWRCRGQQRGFIKNPFQNVIGFGLSGVEAGAQSVF